MDRWTGFVLSLCVLSFVASRVLPRSTEADNFVGEQWSGVRELALVIAIVTLPIGVALVLIQLI